MEFKGKVQLRLVDNGGGGGGGGEVRTTDIEHQKWYYLTWLMQFRVTVSINVQLVFVAHDQVMLH